MRFSFSEEQEQFRAEIRRFLERHSTTKDVRRVMDSAPGYEREVWTQLSQELGLTAIHIPEEYGGAGFSLIELSIAAEEMGRSLLCSPFFASAVLASNALLNGANEATKRALLPPIASGDSIATLAVAESKSEWALDGIALCASPSETAYELSGTKTYVLDGHIAEVIIVAARTADDKELSLFHVAGTARGLQRRLLSTIDATRKQAELVFDRVPAIPIGDIGTGSRALQRTLDQAAIVLANEMVGGAQSLFDAALEYAQLRMQFGRSIGSFQSVKHKFSDLLLHVELAKSAAYYAAAAFVEHDPQGPALASLAKATAADTYMRAATDCIQIHGGIGFTWDHDAHLWYKRAKSSEVFLGDPSFHRERYMQAVSA